MSYLDDLQLLLISETKYYTKYKQLIENSQRRNTIIGYVEKHHIFPRCFGSYGIKDKANIAVLTAKEHFIAHLLLSKMDLPPKLKGKMCYALASFLRAPGHGRKITAAQYEMCRIKFSSFMKNRENVPRGHKASEEAKARMRQGWANRRALGLRTKGRKHSFKAIYMNNGEINIRANPTLMEVYTADGFTVGKLKRTCLCGYSADAQNFKKYHNVCSHQKETHWFSATPSSINPV